MITEPRIPDQETCQRLVANMRRSRLALEKATLELDEITLRLETETQRKSLVRLQRALMGIESES